MGRGRGVESIIVKKQIAHLRADGLRNIAKGIDRGTSNRLLPCLQHIKELEADAHPLFGGNKFRAAIRDASY